MQIGIDLFKKPPDISSGALLRIHYGYHIMRTGEYARILFSPFIKSVKREVLCVHCLPSPSCCQ